MSKNAFVMINFYHQDKLKITNKFLIFGVVGICSQILNIYLMPIKLIKS